MRTRPLVTARYIRSLQLLGWALLALSWLGLGPGCAYARAVLFCCPVVFGLGLALVVIPSLPDLQASQTKAGACGSTESEYGRVPPLVREGKLYHRLSTGGEAL